MRQVKAHLHGVVVAMLSWLKTELFAFVKLENCALVASLRLGKSSNVTRF